MVGDVETSQINGDENMCEVDDGTSQGRNGDKRMTEEHRGRNHVEKGGLND